MSEYFCHRSHQSDWTKVFVPYDMFYYTLYMSKWKYDTIRYDTIEEINVDVNIFKWSIILWRIRRMPVCYLVWEIKLGSDAEKYYKLTTETFNSTGRL